MNATPQTFPYREKRPAAGVTELVGRHGVTTFIGQVERIDVGWAGQLRCVLRLSVGSITVSANRDRMPLDADIGDWLRVKAMPWRAGGDGSLRVLSACVTMPDVNVAWVPTALYHRGAHMQRLRALLATLEPALQLVFMLALRDPRVQRAFFWRVGAADHHGYPGGLLDQSVRAAELVHAQPFESEHERGLATLAALCFDLGKTTDRLLTADAGRLDALAPHPLTQRRLERAFAAVQALHPATVEALRDLLAPSPLRLTLAQRVGEAVRRSWQEAAHG